MNDKRNRFPPIDWQEPYEDDIPPEKVPMLSWAILAVAAICGIIAAYHAF